MIQEVVSCRLEMHTCTAGLEDADDDCPTQEAQPGTPAYIWNQGAERLNVAATFITGFVNRIKQVFVMGKPAAKYLLRAGHLKLIEANM